MVFDQYIFVWFRIVCVHVDVRCHIYFLHSGAAAPEEETALLSKCHEAKQYAYAPYSNFPVGAALLTKQGKLYTGLVIHCLFHL